MNKNEYAENIVKKLLRYREAYYSGNPIISDEEFDAMENELKICDPENDYFKLVGISEDSENTVIKHKYPMMSMQKVKNPDDAENWVFKMYSKYKSDIPKDEWFVYIEPKIDGVSGTVRYDKNGNFMYTATRGKGLEGFAIPFQKVFFKSKAIPEKIDNIYGTDIEIRGEYFIPKNNNQFDNKSLRNITSGILKSKAADAETALIRFIAYDVILHDTDEYIDLDKIDSFLTKNKFFTHPKVKVHIDDIRKMYFKYLNEYRNQWIFMTDGLVLTFPFKELFKDIDSEYLNEHHHNYNMALKPPALFEFTVLKDIEWKVSRLGNLIPIGILDKVSIDNVNISKVTLVSAAFIEENKIAKGCTIKIERANDVMPHYVETAPFPKIKVKLPDKCPVCDTELIRETNHLVCTNTKCKGRIKAEIDYWFGSLHVKGLGEETISKIVDTYEIYDVVDFYEVVLKREFETLFSDNSTKTKDNIYKVVKDSLDKITKIDILIGIGIPSISTKGFKKLGIYDKESLLKYVQKLEIDMKQCKKMLISVIESNILKWTQNEENMNKLEKFSKYFNKAKSSKPNKNALNIAVTGEFEGYTRSSIQNLISSYGDEFSSTVTKSTHYLLNNDGNKLGKYNKALDLGIPIITLEKYKEIKNGK